MEENKNNKKRLLIIILAILLAIILAISIVSIVFTVRNSNEYSYEKVIEYMAGAENIENGIESDDVRFTVEVQASEDRTTADICFTVEYKNTPKERYYDILALQWDTNFLVKHESSDDFNGDLIFPAKLSYTRASDGEKIEIEYTGSKTDGNLYFNSIERYFAFRYPLPKEDLTNLTFTAKLTLVAGSADATAFSTISTFMHQTRDGVFEWSKLRPEGYPVGWRYYTSQYVRDPGYDVVLSLPTIGYLN